VAQLYPQAPGSLFIAFYDLQGYGGGILTHLHMGLQNVHEDPLIGLLCQPRVIMVMEKLTDWLAGETEVLGENLPQCHFVHQQTPHAARTRTRAAAVGS
jgi:hypothetical protein